MEHKELLRRLRRTAKAITASINDVNYGGCGFVAYLAAEEIAATGRMVEIVTPCGTYYGAPAAVVRKDVTRPKSTSDWDNNGLRRSHLAVRFRSGRRTYTWDSDGLRCSTCTFGAGGRYATSSRFGDGLTIAETKGMCFPQVGWNRDFDRKQLPLLKHLVQHHLRFGL